MKNIKDNEKLENNSLDTNIVIEENIQKNKNKELFNNFTSIFKRKDIKGTTTNPIDSKAYLNEKSIQKKQIIIVVLLSILLCIIVGVTIWTIIKAHDVLSANSKTIVQTVIDSTITKLIKI